VQRVDGDRAADLPKSAALVADMLREFAERTGRRLHLEIEPGTYLTALFGAIVTRVIDVVSTGAQGRVFVKLDAGMAEILRPAMYGAQHPLRFLPPEVGVQGGAEPLIVVGPCCESGDVLTPARGDPEALAPRLLPRPRRGDLAVIGAAGAYCAGMAARNYNSIPAAPEVLLTESGALRLVRRRQTLDDVLREEC
jgi:diaminopimelate decarboxylase